MRDIGDDIPLKFAIGSHVAVRAKTSKFYGQTGTVLQSEGYVGGDAGYLVQFRDNKGRPVTATFSNVQLIQA